jgi:murein tripeptide amidase MpaA
MQSPRTLSVDADFDGGNIIVHHVNGPADIALGINRDAHSEFFQWFYFRLAGGRGTPCTVRITGLAGSAYPGGWPHYRAVVSADRQSWTRTETHYADGTLTISITPSSDAVWCAYFAPYSMERHHDLIARVGAADGVRTDILGHSLDGQSIDRVRLGTGPLQCWLYGRQHPGETMAEWWMEGVLERLIDAADPVARTLRAAASFHIVPNMNPDGARRGHLRTNAAGTNLNREWAGPTAAKSPEVLAVLTAMQASGVDFAMDVHGDEAIPHAFIAGFEGIPSITAAQMALLTDYKARLARATPDFQTRIGYPPTSAGKANLTMSTNALAERFGCLAMTLEMPFKDNDDLPDMLNGWSPGRSKALSRDCLAVLAEIVGSLR